MKSSGNLKPVVSWQNQLSFMICPDTMALSGENPAPWETASNVTDLCGLWLALEEISFPLR